MVSSLQLSVLPHKHIYDPPASKSKELAKSKLTTSLSIQEKRKLELIIQSKSDQRPYTAPVYDGYYHAITSLHRQGFRAFFKGLMFRIISQLRLYVYIKALAYDSYSLLDLRPDEPKNIFMSTIKILGFVYLFETISSLFPIMENRFVLQSAVPKFQGRSLFTQYSLQGSALPSGKLCSRKTCIRSISASI